MKKKIFTLLTLALAVCSGAWANHTVTSSGTTVTETWDFGEYTDQVTLAGDNYTITYEGLTLVGNTNSTYTSDYVKKGSGFHMNGASSSNSRHIMFTPSYAGTLTVTYRSNNGNATDRITAIGTDVSTFSSTTENVPNTVLACGYTNGSTNQTISANLTAGTTYYAFFASGGQSIMSLQYVYTLPAASTPTVSVEEGSIDGGASITITSTNATSIYYCWSESDTAPEVGDASYTSASGSSAAITAPNVSATRYLHTYGSNAGGTSSTATFTYTISQAQLAAGLAYATTSVVKTIGDANFTNTLTNPYSLAVTYAITSNGTGSTINSSTGEVTIGGNPGTETITAISEATDGYSAGEATYTLTVNQLFTVTYAIGEGTGVAPAAVSELSSGTSITLPKNFTMYKEGYTLTGWNDGENTYATGDSYTVTGDVTLTAVYTANTVSLDDRTSAVAITFDFRRDNGAPIVQWQNTSDHVWVAQATVQGETIDVMMDINTKPGKFNNASNTDCAQVNANTVFTIPSAKGATVKMECHGSFTISTTTIDGSTNYTGTGTTTITYDVTNTADEIEVVIGDGSYYKYLTVTLPIPEIDAVTSKTWNIGDFTAQKFTTNIVSDDLEIASGVEIDSNSKSYGTEFTSSKRAKLPKNGSTTSGYLHFKVAGPSIITVYAMSSNSSNARNITIYAGSTLLTKDAGGSALEKFTAFYSGSGEQDVYVYTTNTGGTVNVYGIKVENSVKITPAYAKTTYVTAYPLDFGNVSGLKAYVATAAAAGKVTLTEVTEPVPAATPLMLIGTANTEYTVPVVASAEAPATNLFVAGDGTTEFDGSTYDYILYSDELFYQIGSGSVAVGKAYLHCESDPTAAGSRSLAISFGDETTGISSMHNSQCIMHNEIYNLSGQRVGQPVKGLYIVNGKKVLVK